MAREFIVRQHPDLTKSVPQIINLKRIDRQLEQIGAPRSTLASLIGISESMMSRVFTGERCLSLAAQNKVFEVVEFLKELKETSALPVNFSDPVGLRPFFEAWKRRRLETEVVRTEEEIRADEDRRDSTHQS